MTASVTRYGRDGGGARAASFHPESDIEVLVRSWNAEKNDRVYELACHLADGVSSRNADASTIESLRRDIESLREALAATRRQIPPKKPALLLGPACARFTEKGVLWLLNRRDKGWGEFGFAFEDGWDEVFRRYNVRVTGHGTDAHGQYWMVENVREGAL